MYAHPLFHSSDQFTFIYQFINAKYQRKGIKLVAKYTLDIQPCLVGVGLDEATTGWNRIAHEHVKGAVGLSRVLNVDLEDGAILWVHGRVPKLLVIHLSQALVALLDANTFVAKLFTQGLK